ncbi:alpha-ketoacid dehydrogenase subunit alpha/beta [Opitutus sp. ER46]|uniref:alpha-ketoacid dehydrogenase subunit alpha/beta n=1 Tax=Opitutus sp. ER46 TaxID=2161864 RepID=UPI000D304108|nr:alpha-ketoacid dehydrogenase subunit alpha/beta [Opitutus sp. ER46]PTX97711.1 transketolase [Opitutus sp. ER46]
MAFPSSPTVLAARSLTAAELETQRAEALLKIYAWMHLSRAADNRILELFRQGLIRGTVTGGQGNEGLIVPLALLADKATDVVSFTHRDLGGHLIWSGHLCEHLNQYFANAGSPTKAREGNIHHGDPAHRSLPMISHLGTMLSNVAGATDSQRRQGRKAVGFALFGDGGSSTGDIHETLNLASLLSLPVVFVIENNGYAYSTPVCEQFAAGTELWRRAAGYGIEGFAADATDPEAWACTLAATIEKVRATSRPVLIEAHTLRLRGHAAYDTCDYLLPGESDGFFARDPLPKLRARVVAAVGAARVEALEAELNAHLEACVQVALGTPRPTPGNMEADLFAPESALLPWQPTPAEPAQLNLAQAVNLGLRKILTERPESLVMGQDIGTYGGAFKVTDGLLKEFGRPRVFNTPLAESACTGYAIGLALNGHRPIEEFQFADFSTEATTQITQNAATMHFRSGASCPLVFRLPAGGGLTFGSFHSQELESFFLAMPGLKALYPSTPQDAFNALLAAYEDNNPVLLFEHKGLYRRGKATVAWDPAYREVWQPRQVARGDYATFVTYGEMVHVATDAAAYLREEYELAFDLFDLRALSPLRLDAIEASLARTGRLIVLHEGRRTHGFGAELVARLTEQHFSALKAAPLRIAALDLPVPFAPELEAVYRPTKDAIVERIAAWMQ